VFVAPPQKAFRGAWPVIRELRLVKHGLAVARRGRDRPPHHAFLRRDVRGLFLSDKCRA
jgi:hypothetical protein